MKFVKDIFIKKPFLLFLFFSLATSFSFAELTTKDYSVMINAIPSVKPNPRIEINWKKDTSCNYIAISRRLQAIGEWDTVAILDKFHNSFVDSNVQIGKKYEYGIRIYFNDRTAYNYFSSGVEIPIEEFKGKLLLFVDKTIINPLKTELETYISDLEGDGWRVIQYNVDRTEKFNGKAVQKIKDYIDFEYFRNGKDIKSIILLGRTAIPYSGAYAIDAHIPDHYGAWPSDVFYATFEGEWTDSLADTKDARRKENWNIPYDGKFDNNVIPSDAIYQVGRIDFYNLPVFKETEIELLRRYLNKNHDFRNGKLDIPNKALLDDKLGFYSEEYFASTAWMNFASLVSENNIDTTLFTMPKISQKNYLFSFGCAGSGYNVVGDIMTTEYASKNDINAVFTSYMGSYFGDWDSENNVLRAILASKPQALTTCFNGRPYIWFHHMGIGETIGYSMMQSQNNRGVYIANDVWGHRGNHISLLGDPTLTMTPVIPPVEAFITQLSKNNVNKILQLNWKAPKNQQNVLGYNIYKYTKSDKRYRLIKQLNQSDFSYNDTCDASSENKYFIKTLALITSNTATYYKESQGIGLNDIQINNYEEKNHFSSDDVIIKMNGSILEITNPELHKISEIEIYSINGMNIAQYKQIEGTYFTFDLSDLNNGVYFIKLKANESIIVRKLLKIEN
jgi:hypothetical protein